MLEKKKKSDAKQEAREKERRHSMGHIDEEDEHHDHDHNHDKVVEEKDNMLAWSEEDIPSCPKAQEVYVMQQIELDNLRDIEDPFVFVHHDDRENKVEISPLTIAPTDDRAMDCLNMKLTFQDSAFWYMKGYDAERVKHMESAIDSYRQAIRLDTKHVLSMVNLAAQYEEQHRFDTACKWYKIAMRIDPECLEAYFGYAISRFKEGKPKESVEHLNIAIEKLGGIEI